MGLSDADVEKQIKHMIAFIDQEADEKVDEISAKADEEFEIEKTRLVNQQRQKIMLYYERKEKQLEQQKKIQHSQLVNAARLKILKFREDHIQTILNEAREKLSEVQKDKGRYAELLSGLIAQGLFQILENYIIVKCLVNEVDLVQAAIPKAVAQIKEKAGRDVNVVINDKDFLTADSCGGIEMTSKNGSIKVCNTLDARLGLIGKQL
ncbi:V-type proton ATPase subunit E-like isoform X2 [Clavelina lepadiformis]|uniref:V-type proton ATPase subunit E-like isoform X2 n=1 Tax=Clavelina lepadiformis TaxID=159417 RepID=UPI0040422F7F